MSWRTVVVTGSAKIEYKLEYLVIRKINSTTRIHLSEIGILLIDSTAVSMTAVVLCELIKHKVKVIFCDEKHNPISELHPYFGSHDTSQKVIDYCTAIRKLTGRNVVILVNCLAYLSNESLSNLQKWCQYQKITTIMINPVQRGSFPFSNEYIIDDDLCIIH